MSGHHPVDDSLVAYALDELGATEREEISSHVAECKTCADIVSRLTSAIETYRTSPSAGAPPGLLAELLEAQRAAQERAASAWWRPRPALAAAVITGVAVLFLSGFLAGRVSAPARTIQETHLEAQTVIPRPLPDPPVIGFQTEPPLGARFAVVGGSNQLQRTGHERNNSSRDSL
jgi:anti-sigma factor RsiW